MACCDRVLDRRAPAFLKELELYATLRRHESAVVVAKLKRPTILTDETSGESVAFVDAEDLAMDDDERNENDALLSNYCLTCPLRSGDEEPSMCGFECAIRSRIEARFEGAAHDVPRCRVFDEGGRFGGIPHH